MSLIKNGKFFLLPERKEEDFKVLFARVAAAGVGRPVDKDGCPQGPWTSELLATAISEIEVNRAGIELRTVQLWFEDNDKGISPTNIRWLARVLGCNDPEAASAWQAELSAAQSRLTAKRRADRRGKAPELAEPERNRDAQAGSGLADIVGVSRPFGLAGMTAALFSRGSILNLPAAVFAGAVALQFVSYFLSIHSVTYLREDGVVKQVGFLWAPNWTVLFIVLLPLFLAIVADQVSRWTNVERPRLLSVIGSDNQTGTWTSRVEASSDTYWVVLLICVGIVGVFQWISVRLLPLLNGGGNYPVDWGALALVRPDQIGLLAQIAFTGTAYLYMCLCFYLFIAGLILLASLVDDAVHIITVMGNESTNIQAQAIDTSGSSVVRCLARCAMAGLLIAISMKIESLYRVTSAPDILDWLISDARLVLSLPDEPVTWLHLSSPTHYTSLLVAFLVSVVYLYGTVRITGSGIVGRSMGRANVAVVILIAAYLLIGVIPGFSLLLGAGLVVALLGLFDPDFRFWRERDGGRSCVP